MIRRLFRFSARVVRRLYRNHGLLLASAIAFDTLLSIVPLLALVLVALSHVVDPAAADRLLRAQLETLLPGAAGPVTRAYRTFLQHRDVAGVFGLVGLVVFGASAFRTAREAMTVLAGVEQTRARRRSRGVLLPLAYVLLTAVALMAGTAFMTALDSLPPGGATILGKRIEVAQASRSLLHVAVFVALVVLFSSFYRLLPASPAPMRHVALGGLVAAVIWEAARRVLVWYFAHLSLVGAVYGSLTSVVVLLVSLDVGALAFLLGGQIVAELARSAQASLPWHEEPPA